MIEGTAVSYRVFVRNWWRYEDGRFRVPHPEAKKTTLASHMTYEEAQRMAHAYNATHVPGPLSRKAEFERE